MTVILNITSTSTDLSLYAGLLKDGDSLIVVNSTKNEALDDGVRLVGYEGNKITHVESIGENIVKLYNELVADTKKESDILLLSDNIKLHTGLYENMNSCLYVTEKHAIVYGQEITDNKSLIKTAGKYLPEYSITIKPNAHCALIKRTVINTLGFLDATYSSLQYALMDYYCRINIYGFSSIISHHALFSYNNLSDDFICSEDEKLFASRYEFWQDKEWRYALYGTHPCLEFLELLDEEFFPKKRILFDCSIMPAHHCGTSEYQISVFDAFKRLFGEKYDIFLYTNHEADEYHKLSTKYENVYFPDTLTGTFHLGFTPNQLMQFEPQLTINKRCLKSIQTMFDIMMVRIDEHLYTSVNSDVELGIRYSDGIVFISNYTKHDFLACFTNESSIKDKQLRVIYPATGLDAPFQNDYELPFEDYFLIVGGHFKHKGVKETIEAVVNSRFNFIAIGYEDNNHTYPNVHSYKGGLLDEDFLSYLYANCKAVIFPSLYEGFGLPVVISLKNNKRVIVHDNGLNKELRDHFQEFKEHFLLFENFEHIKEIIENTDFSAELKSGIYDDTWDRVATQLESFFDEIMKTKTDPDSLNERWHMYKLIEARLIDAEQRIEAQKAKLTNEQQQSYQQLYHQFGDYKLTKLLRFALKEHIKNKHPGLFKLLKGNLKKT